MVEPLEEPCRRGLTDPDRVLVDDRQRRPKRCRQREVAEADECGLGALRRLEGRDDADGASGVGGETLAVCQEIIDDCRATGVPVVIENLVYPLPGRDLHGAAREDAIIEAARALNNLDIDLLKLEYPGSPSGCRRLASILDRPWAVLSAGVPFAEFSQVIRVAFDEGGASGFIAGRSVWREAVALDGADREKFLLNVARPRLEELTAVAATYGQPWDGVGQTG